MNRISHEDFVTIWQTSTTAEEAAAIVSAMAGKNVSPHAVGARACAYRRAGVRLKRMSAATAAEVAA